MAGTSVMGQSLFEENGAGAPLSFAEEMSEGQEALRAELALVAERIDGLERKQAHALRTLDERQSAALAAAGASAAAAARQPVPLRTSAARRGHRLAAVASSPSPT